MRKTDGAWAKMFSAHSTRTEVDAAVERWVRVALDTFAGDLASDPALTPRQRAMMVARLAPRVRAETARTFLDVWDRLRAELHDADNDTVH